MKRAILIGGVILILIVGWYVVSPIFILTELNEEVGDAFETMDEEAMESFDNAVESSQEENKEMQEEMSGELNVLFQNDFHERAHEVKGKALLIESLGKKILRFEDFETINGPNLHVYLSSDLGDKDFIDLGELKATKGNFNYELDSSIDTTKYNKVLIWCVPFRVLFSYSELK